MIFVYHISVSLLKKFLKKEIVERYYRFSVMREHNLALAIDGEAYNILNISLSGIAVESEKLSQSVNSNEEHLLSLRINNQILDISARVARKNGNTIGLAVSSNLEKYQNEVKAFFECETYALKVKKKEVEDPKLEDYDWYSGDRFHEVYLKGDDNQISEFWINFQNTIFHFSAKRNKLESFLFTRANFDLNEDLTSYEHDPNIGLEMLPFIRRFIFSIKELQSDDKEFILSKLKM